MGGETGRAQDGTADVTRFLDLLVDVMPPALRRRVIAREKMREWLESLWPR